MAYSPSARKERDRIRVLFDQYDPGMLTQGGQGGRPAPLASRLHSIPTHFPLILHGIWWKFPAFGPPSWLTGSYHPRYDHDGGGTLGRGGRSRGRHCHVD
jgi:hypothetical protein